MQAIAGLRLEWREPKVLWTGLAWLLGGPLNPCLLYGLSGGTALDEFGGVLLTISLPSALAGLFAVWRLRSGMLTVWRLIVVVFTSALLAAYAFPPIGLLFTVLTATPLGPNVFEGSIVGIIISMLALGVAGVLLGALFWFPAASAAFGLALLIAFRFTGEHPILHEDDVSD